jgi:hypothetical protein
MRPEGDQSDFGGPQQLQNAWQILAGGAPSCARALVHIATEGRVEAAQVAAAKTVLEMMGFNAGNDVNVRLLPQAYDSSAPTDLGAISAADRVRARMKELRGKTVVDADPDYGQIVPTDEIVDAVIIED